MKRTQLQQAVRLALLTAALGWSMTGSAAEQPAVQASGDFWQDAAPAATTSAQRSAAPADGPQRYHAATLNRNGIRSFMASAPRERSVDAESSPLIVSLPHPDGGYQRFAIVDSPVMEEGLAAKHPEIRTFSGRGVDDPTATLRMDITPLGLHASVRSPQGRWFVDPRAVRDDSVYHSYHARDLPNRRGPLREAPISEPQLALERGFYHAGDALEVRGAGFAPGASVSISVRNPQSDTGPRQSVVVNANADGVVKAALVAEPSRETGSYEVTANDGRATSTVTYQVVADDTAAAAATGNLLRTYRLALVTDPSYAAYFGPENVTAAKVTLINRVTQVYEDETSIRLVLINNTDALNLNTDAAMTGANGPCGGAACFTPVQASTCGSGTLTRNRVVAGLLAGASNYDVGHIALGLNGGGIAGLGVVGAPAKAQGCTGLPTPVGDFYAVDYVAHELGHQFAGNHTFNGINSNCSGGNRNDSTSVEPGSGSSIMAYAGICGTDNLQTHSDAYWSQRSFDEIVALTSSAESLFNEVQMGVLTGFTANGASFRLTYNGVPSAPIVRGTNYTAAGVKAAIQGIAGWPAGGSVTVSALTDNAFTLTFGGMLAGINVPMLGLTPGSAAIGGYVGEITAGGPGTRGGTASGTGNSVPVVTVAPRYTIPLRTPFALTGSAQDADGDTITYLWEQNDNGGSAGTGLISNVKTNGPLFRQFGVRAVVSASDTIEYNSPGENHVTTDPTRVFPDLAQILANNTNAASGACPTVTGTPTASVIECYAEFLPTAAYVGLTGTSPASLNFKLTARDGRGGVGNATTQLVLASGAGPFLVTAPAAGVTAVGGATLNVAWNVANTSAAPVGTANVKISLSTDGGQTFPTVLAASTPNSGSKAVVLPAVATSAARIKVEAIGNVFFDISHANFAITLAGDVNADGAVNCADLALARGALGRRSGQAGYLAGADINKDNMVDIRDIAVITRALPGDLVCQ
ncbi:MAG: M12 family metallo-peptidase [Duganella sp.]